MEYLKAKGTSLITESGKEILLEGFGLGGWLLPEGYMWKLFTKCDRPRRMEQLIETLCGTEYAETFWEQYFDNYITRKDIELIAKQGFNSIRLPLNSRHLFDENKICFIQNAIARVDNLVKWCKEFSIYVILDMHGAPGGQTGENIDDCENNIPELFIKQEHRNNLITLWQLLAQRYKDEPCIAGYDLLNEPLPNWFSEHNSKVLPLYRDIAKVIRQVDKRHMIILEGVHWATNFEIFDELKTYYFDDNYMLQFHRYWSTPDKESIATFISYSQILNVPLFMGEGGENNIDWYIGFFSMLIKENISYSFWSYKKMAADNSPVTFGVPDEWDKLIDYIDNRTQFTQLNAQSIFDSFIDKIKHPSINKTVFDSLKRKVPISIPAEYFDDSYTIYPREKGVDIRTSENVTILFQNDRVGIPDYKRYGGESQPETEQIYVKIHTGEWLEYQFGVEKNKTYELQIVCKAEPDNTLVQVILDNNVSVDFCVGQQLEHIHVGEMELITGWHRLRIIAQDIILINKIVIKMA